jgi:capsular exopolysaccharide synthesis family protein
MESIMGTKLAEEAGQHQTAPSPAAAEDVHAGVLNWEAALNLDDVPVLATTLNPINLVARTAADTLPAERFRMLANRLLHLRRSRELKIVQVTSSVIGEGKSTISANLAVTLARRPSQRVLLLEGDLRKPALTEILGAVSVPGLGEWWEKADLGAPLPVYRVAGLGLWFLPAGAAKDVTDVMQSPLLPQVLTELAKHFDWVIIDSPPLLPIADAAIWARLADGTLLVLRAAVAPKKAVRKALENLDNARLLGFVLNDSPDRFSSRYYDQYYGLYLRKGE